MIVLSNSPRSDKSCINVAIPLSISGNCRRIVRKFSLCVSQPPVVDRDIRNAALDQPPRHEARLAKFGSAVTVAQFRFSPGIDRTPSPRRRESCRTPVFRLRSRLDLRIAGYRVRQRVELVQQFAPVLLALFRDAREHHAFHRERRLRRITAGREWFVPRAQKSRLVENRPCGCVNTM